MNLDDILQLIEAAKETDFDSFEIEENDFYFRMERNKPVQQVVTPVHLSTQSAPDAAVPMQSAQPTAIPAAGMAEVAEDTSTDAQPQRDPGTKDITSPLVGVYHELPDGKAVKMGDKLNKGDVVCIVEAMKLMNEIEMPEDGEIMWVAAEEGDTIEYEQVLFSYK